MPEQFAFDKVFRQGGAVDADHRLVGAVRVAVEPTRHQFFADACFTGDENGQFTGRHQVDFPSNCLNASLVPIIR